jgi:hypothetical protein
MRQTTFISKVFISILAIGFALWFGGTVTRSTIAYDLMIPGEDFKIKNWYSPEAQQQSAYLYAITAVYVDSGYAAALVSALALAILYRRELRKRGWVFMAFVLFFIAAPVQLYLIYLDIKLSMAMFYDNAAFHDDAVRKYLIERYSDVTVNTISALAFLAMLTSLIYVIWRPLDRPQKSEETT